MSTMPEFITKERERLAGEQAAIAAEQKVLEDKLEAITRQLKAFDAFESVYNGKQKPTKAAKTGTQKEMVLATVKEHPGSRPSEIADKLNGQVPKAGVHNILGQLKKDGKVTVTDKRYTAV